MYKIRLLFGLFMVISSCNNKEQKSDKTLEVSEKNYHHIEQIKWLVGNWTNITPEEQSYESWLQLNDSTLTAFSYTTVLNDTVFQENLMVQQSADNVVLIVRVPNQNDEKPVTFKLLTEQKGVITFENRQHDFPNKISYSNPVKDSIHAWIEGQIDGTYKKIDFSFKRRY